MKFKLSNIHLLLLLATTLFGCAKNDMTNADDTKPDLIIISTNDIHSNIDRIPKLATLTKLQRKEHKNVILLDAGDRQNGDPSVDYAKQPGKPIIEIMNLLGYNIATLGEHDFDYGQESLSQNMEHASFGIVCANISSNNVVGEFEPYQFINVANKKIAVIGLINIDRLKMKPPTLANKLNNLAFEDPVVVAKQYKTLTSRADMLIILSHCGISTDTQIAINMPQADLIIGGGSHEAIFDPKEVNGVTLTQTGSRLKNAGITKVWFHKNGDIECRNSLVDLDKFQDDEEFKIIVNNTKSASDFSTIIGENSADMDKTAIATLLCNSMMKSSGSSYALYNIESINRDRQPKGKFTLHDLYSIESYKYNFYRLPLTLSVIRNIIEEQYNSRKIKNEQKALHFQPLNYDIKTDNQGNLTSIIFYDDKTIITDYSMILNTTLDEHTYFTYSHLLNETTQPIGKVTNSVIDYYKQK